MKRKGPPLLIEPTEPGQLPSQHDADLGRPVKGSAPSTPMMPMTADLINELLRKLPPMR
jgi:hypothetical protein